MPVKTVVRIPMIFFTTVLCLNRNLQQQKISEMKSLQKALKTISDKDDVYDLARGDFKRLEEARQCPTVACIEKNMPIVSAICEKENIRKMFSRNLCHRIVSFRSFRMDTNYMELRHIAQIGWQILS